MMIVAQSSERAGGDACPWGVFTISGFRQHLPIHIKYRSFTTSRSHAPDVSDRSVKNQQRVIEIVHRGANLARRKV
jgi:hypothetical protein